MAINCHKAFYDIVVEFSSPFDHLCRNGKVSFLVTFKRCWQGMTGVDAFDCFTGFMKI